MHLYALWVIFSPMRSNAGSKTTLVLSARLPKQPGRSPTYRDLAGPKHVALSDRVSHACARLIWPTVPAGHPDEEPLDILASVLGGLANENRLFRRCIYDEPLAVQVGASHPTYELAGEFRVELFVQPERQLADIVRIADQEIERLKKDGPSIAELAGHRSNGRRCWSGNSSRQRESRRSLPVGRVTRRFTRLPGGHRKGLRRNPRGHRRVARKYLRHNRLELDIIRAPGRSFHFTSRASRPHGHASQYPRTIRSIQSPRALPCRRSARLRVSQHQNSSGTAQEWSSTPHRRAHDVPLVSLSLVVQSGETSTQEGKEGLCSITATLLDEGTKSHSALEIAGSLSDIGASISTRSGRDSMEINLTTLTSHIGSGLDIYADVIVNPKFGDADLQRLKFERLATLESVQRDPERIAADVFDKLVYSRGNPYGRPYLGTRQSIKSITRDDVVGFYRQTMVPGNAELVVVGDTTPEKIVARAGKEPGIVATRASSTSSTGFHTTNKREPAALPRRPAGCDTVNHYRGRRWAERSFGTIQCACHDRLADVGRKWQLREEKGNSYSFSPDHQFRKGPSAFAWTGGVQTSATRDSVIDVISEVSDASGPKAASDDDITHIEASKAASAFSSFETVAGVAFQIHYLVAYNLGDDYHATRVRPAKHVTEDDIDRVARQYLKPEAMTILVVGDRSKIEGPLKSIPFVKSIRLLDAQGNPLPGQAVPKSVAN